MFQLTPMEEHWIRSDDHLNNADALGVAPYVAGEIAFAAKHGLSSADEESLDAAFQIWANQPAK